MDVNSLFIAFLLSITLVAGLPASPSNSITVNSNPSSSQIESNGVDCKTELSNFNETMIKMVFFFDPTVVKFSSPEDFSTRYCSHFLDYNQKIQRYRRCLRPFVSTLFSFIVRQAKMTFERFCQGSGVDLVYNHLKCMDNTTKVDIMLINDVIHEMLRYTSTQALNDIIPVGCCAFNKLITDVEGKIGEICQGKGQRDTPEFIIKIIKGIISDLFDMMCVKYPTVDSCLKQDPEMMQRVTIAMTNLTRNHDSMFLPILDILTRLDGDLNLNN